MNGTIDRNARDRIANESRMAALVSGLGKTIGDALSKKNVLEKDDSGGMSLKVKFEDSGNPEVTNSLDKLGKALVMIYNHLQGFKITLPKIFEVKGSVDVDSVADLPPVHIQNFKDLRPYFEMSEKAIKQLAAAITIMSSKSTPIVPKAPIINFDTRPLLDALQELKEVSGKPSDNKDMVKILRNVNDGISALVDKPTFSPPAVTNVNINALQGYAKTTNLTLGTTVTSLPAYGQLFNRRSVLIYNNSANVIYIGGSDVTTTNGLPVPANSYSPIIDAGYNMIVYGVASQGGNNVRVLELSKDQTSNIQE